jgi:hypothetical protein
MKVHVNRQVLRRILIKVRVRELSWRGGKMNEDRDVAYYLMLALFEIVVNARNLLNILFSVIFGL